MGVRAKFKVTSITESTGSLKTVQLQPVVSGSEENKQFFKYSPSGQISLGVMNPDAAAQFAVDQEFYVDFTLA